MGRFHKERKNQSLDTNCAVVSELIAELESEVEAFKSMDLTHSTDKAYAIGRINAYHHAIALIKEKSKNLCSKK